MSREHAEQFAALAAQRRGLRRGDAVSAQEGRGLGKLARLCEVFDNNPLAPRQSDAAGAHRISPNDFEVLGKPLVESLLRHQPQAALAFVVELHRALVGAKELIAGVEDKAKHRFQIVLHQQRRAELVQPRHFG